MSSILSVPLYGEKSRLKFFERHREAAAGLSGASLPGGVEVRETQEVGMNVCKGLHHVAMAIQDREVYERTTAFYKDLIGLPLIRTWARGPRHITMLDFGNSILEIVFGAEGAGTGVFAHIALAVERPEDVDAMLERCVAWGCILSRPAEDVLAGEETCGGERQPGSFRMRNGFCTGPAGESLEFFCEF